MKRIRPLKRAAAASVLILPLFAAGCGLLGGQTPKQIDPPQQVLPEEGGANAGPAAMQPSGDEAAGMTPITVYVRDRGGYLAPVSVHAADGAPETRAAGALEMMVEGSALSGLLPEGFDALLPQGTQVAGVTIAEDTKLAVVDFAGAFTDYNPQDERRILEAVVWTLTGLPDVEQVMIRHDGERLNEMPVDGYPLDKPLTRAMGVNLEAAPGVSYGSSMPVTLYFSAMSDEGKQYYVPVTRLIERAEDRAKAALEQLIAGPLYGVELNGVMTQDVEVASLAVEGDTAIVDLNDEAYVEGHPVPAEMLQAVVLAVTENSSAHQVQIRVNGASEVKDTENRSYGTPVGRPEYVNDLKA